MTFPRCTRVSAATIAMSHGNLPRVDTITLRNFAMALIFVTSSAPPWSASVTSVAGLPVWTTIVMDAAVMMSKRRLEVDASK